MKEQIALPWRGVQLNGVPRELSAMPGWKSELGQEEGAQGICGVCPAQAPTAQLQP